MKNLYFQPGDIITVNRFLYQHYGIYAGNGRVIHYSSNNGDFGFDIMVREISLEQFARGGKCKAVRFSDNETEIYSPEETLNRARSRIGDKKYNLLFNNCEHFALWCKTGKNKSGQIEKAAGTIVVFSVAAIAATIVVKINRMIEKERG